VDDARLAFAAGLVAAVVLLAIGWVLGRGYERQDRRHRDRAGN
jgi:hypothetical protein